MNSFQIPVTIFRFTTNFISQKVCLLIISGDCVNAGTSLNDLFFSCNFIDHVSSLRYFVSSTFQLKIFTNWTCTKDRITPDGYVNNPPYVTLYMWVLDHFFSWYLLMFSYSLRIYIKNSNYILGLRSRRWEPLDDSAHVFASWKVARFGTICFHIKRVGLKEKQTSLVAGHEGRSGSLSSSILSWQQGAEHKELEGK